MQDKALFAVRVAILTVLTCVLSACGTPGSIVTAPTAIRPPAKNENGAKNGAIYQASNAKLHLFEDRIARNLGDTLTIQIEEKLDIKNKAETKSSRTDSINAGLPTISGTLVPKIIQDLASTTVTGSSTSAFSGKGESNNSNTFTGMITVEVAEVLNNGNLLVAGEKQIALNYDVEYIRFSGVVDPRDIKPGNIISSTKVAEARIEQRGSGQTDASQAMGWLAKFFLTVLPF